MTMIGNYERVQDSSHQAADYVRKLTLTDDNDNPFDWTGYSAQLQWRSEPGWPAVANLTSETGGGIVLSSNGEIEYTVPQAVMANIPAGNYVYDVLVSNDAAGTFTVLLIVEVRHEARHTVWEVIP